MPTISRDAGIHAITKMCSFKSLKRISKPAMRRTMKKANSWISSRASRISSCAMYEKLKPLNITPTEAGKPKATNKERST